MKYLTMWFKWCESFRNKKLKDYQRIYEENNKKWQKEFDEDERKLKELWTNDCNRMYEFKGMADRAKVIQEYIDNKLIEKYTT